MTGLRHALAFRKKLLVQTLSRAHSSFDNIDIFVRDESVQLDDSTSDIDDLHRLAHIEHEDLPVIAHDHGLQHERNRFWDRHKEALHVAVCDRDGPAVANLVNE